MDGIFNDVEYLYNVPLHSLRPSILMFYLIHYSLYIFLSTNFRMQLIVVC